MQIQHTVVFRLRHDRGSAAEADFLRTSTETLTAIPGVRDFRVLRQVSSKSAMTHQFTMSFDSPTAYDAYDGHPDHRAFVADRWVPEVVEFQEFDFVE